ncbi:MAG: outer membrane beta-barrel protein [Pseudomonadota bacterium]
MLRYSLSVLAATALLTSASALPAFAEMEISVYGGANFSPHSRVKTFDAAGNQTSSNSVGWDGASFQMPPYYGVRGTYWFENSPGLGIALDFTHAKVKADPLPAGFTDLEFTDGINFLTANLMYRMQLDASPFTPYVGAGVGLSIPHVEVDGPVVNNNRTYDYQVTGFAAQALVGVDYEITNNWSVFGELKSTYGQVEADLTGGGKLDTDVISNQIIFGVSYKFQ